MTQTRDPFDLFSILPDEEKRKIVRDVYKRHAEAMSADLVRAEIIAAAKSIAPELARVAVDAFAREFSYAHTAFGSRTSQWDDMVKDAIRKGVADHLDKMRITITPAVDAKRGTGGDRG